MDSVHSNKRCDINNTAADLMAARSVSGVSLQGGRTPTKKQKTNLEFPPSSPSTLKTIKVRFNRIYRDVKQRLKKEEALPHCVHIRLCTQCATKYLRAF